MESVWIVYEVNSGRGIDATQHVRRVCRSEEGAVRALDALEEDEHKYGGGRAISVTREAWAFTIVYEKSMMQWYIDREYLFP